MPGDEVWEFTPVLAGDNEDQSQGGSHEGQHLCNPMQLHFYFVGAEEKSALWREDQDGFRQAEAELRT